jgi:Ca2+:H+ antiporter
VLLLLYVCYFWYFYGTHPIFGGFYGTVKTGNVIPALISAAIASPRMAELMSKHHREQHSKDLRLNPIAAVILAIAAAAISATCNLCLVKVLDASSRELHISKSFLGLVILPFVLGAVDIFTAAAHARKQEMDWTIQITIVSSIRIALFVLPVTICLAWILHIESMTLFFDRFQISVVFLAVFLVNHIFGSQGAEGGKW